MEAVTTPNSMRIEEHQFRVVAASFRYITQSWSGSGWDFSFQAACANAACGDVFPSGAMLRAEASPLPLAKLEDFTGAEVSVVAPYDEESGEPFFGLMVGEEHDVFNLKLRFVERDGDHYLIQVDADVASSLLGRVAKVQVLAWAEQQPDHAYPT